MFRIVTKFLKQVFKILEATIPFHVFNGQVTFIIDFLFLFFYGISRFPAMSLLENFIKAETFNKSNPLLQINSGV